MQFASGKGTGTYRLDSGTSQYFVDPTVPNTTLTVGSGVFPQRTFVQGNYVPGIVVGSGQTVNGYRCALNSNTSGNDVGQITVTLSPSSAWTGAATVYLQGSFNRYSNAAINWVNIDSGKALTSSSAGYSINYNVSSDQMWPAYRLQVVSTNGVGNIDWAIVNMFPDLSAELIGFNALNVNGSLGQPAVLTNSTKPFGRETSWVGTTGNSGPNQQEIGTMFTPGGQM